MEDSERVFLIEKSGYYYRANRSGYTQELYAAGRYTLDEAEKEALIEPLNFKIFKINFPKKNSVITINTDNNNTNFFQINKEQDGSLKVVARKFYEDFHNVTPTDLLIKGMYDEIVRLRNELDLVHGRVALEEVVTPKMKTAKEERIAERVRLNAASNFDINIPEI